MEKASQKGKDKPRFIPLFQTGERNRLPRPISLKKSKPLDEGHNILPNPISRETSRHLDVKANRVSRETTRPSEGKSKEEHAASGKRKTGGDETNQRKKRKQTQENQRTPEDDCIDEFEDVSAVNLADASPMLEEELQTTVQQRTEGEQHDEQKSTDEENHEPYSSGSECEEQGSGDNDVLNTTELWPGCLVWAQQTGYPWWPAIIERDPDTDKYCHLTSRTNRKPCRYHVTYLGEPVSRSWLSCDKIKPFGELTLEQAITMTSQKRHMIKLKKAVDMAAQVQKVTLTQRRIDLFGFQSRFVAEGESSQDSDFAEILDELYCHTSNLKQKNNKATEGRGRRKQRGESDENDSDRTEEEKKEESVMD